MGPYYFPPEILVSRPVFPPTSWHTWHPREKGSFAALTLKFGGAWRQIAHPNLGLILKMTQGKHHLQAVGCLLERGGGVGVGIVSENIRAPPNFNSDDLIAFLDCNLLFSSSLLFFLSTIHTEFTLDTCKVLAAKCATVDALPIQCKKYSEVLKSSMAGKKEDPFAGMTGRAAAQSARMTGRESQAQIQRRLTSTCRFKKPVASQ